MEEIYHLIQARCGGNPLNAEWGDIYPQICRSIALLGKDLYPSRERHQLLVVAAAIHYVRESFQSEGKFWERFMADVGISSRAPLFEAIYNWMVRNGVTVRSGPSQRREVVQTLLAITGVPAHWNRDFAEFFIWYFRTCRNEDAEVAWTRYPAARQMENRSSSFIPTANKLNRVFQHLMDGGVDPETNPSDICDAVVEQLGPDFDPRRLVRRQDSFLRLWRELFERLTPGQFRRWLRKRSSAWVSTPNHKVEAARKILMADQIEFGTYVCDGDRIDVVPHPKVSLYSIAREWPNGAPWFGLPGYVGFLSVHQFRIFRDGQPYDTSRPFLFEGVQRHVALVPLPLGGNLELPSGDVVAGRRGLELAPPNLWLERRSGEASLYLDIPRTVVARPEMAHRAFRLEVLSEEGLLAQTSHHLDQRGFAELHNWRVPLPHPTSGRIRCRLILAEECQSEHSVTLPPAMLFSPSGDLVRPNRRRVAVGERRYTLLLAEGEPLPDFDAASLVLEWLETKCGIYRVAKVRWVHGRFSLSAGGCSWEFERGFESDLWITCHTPAPLPNQQVFLELPANAVHSLRHMQLRVITSDEVTEEQLSLLVFRNNLPVESLSIGPGDLVAIAQSHLGQMIWGFTDEVLQILHQAVQQPGMYDLALSLSNIIVSRFRFYLVPRVQFPLTLPPAREGTRVPLRVQATEPVFLRQDGQIVHEVEVTIPYRVHEVPEDKTGVRCYSEPYETTITFAHPQLTATLKAAPVVCGIRTLVKRQGQWGKEPRPTFEELAHAGIYVFGPLGATVDLTADGGTLARIQLNSEGQGLFEQLSGLAEHCVEAVTTFQIEVAGAELPFVVSRKLQYKNLLYESAIQPGSTFTFSLEVTGPVGTDIALLLSSSTQDIQLQHKVLDGSPSWLTLHGILPGEALSGAADWRLILLVNGRKHLLGKVWYLGLARGGIGDHTGIPAGDLPRLAGKAAHGWLKGEEVRPLIIWGPSTELRDKCVEHIQARCPNVVVYAPEYVGGGEPITEDLLSPGQSLALEGLGIPEGMAPQEALSFLADQTSVPMLVREAHLLSVFERSILQQLRRKIVLVADSPIRL